MKAKKNGYRSCVLFIVQRTDAQKFAPNDETDPIFGKTLRVAAQQGVEVYAYCSEFIKSQITLKGRIDVDLDTHIIAKSTS